MKLSIIIPARNEGKRIGNTLKEYLSFFKKQKIDFEIIVVLNNCTDNTKEVVEKYSCNQLKVIKYAKPGKGFAITEGFKDALKRKNDLIGFVDADMSTSPYYFYELVENIDKTDMVIAGRYLKGSVVRPKQPISRIILSRMGNFFIRSLFWFPYKDTQCGAKLCKRKALEEVMDSLTMSEWLFDVNLIYSIRKKGYKIKEIPTVWQDKKNSGLNLKKASIQCFLAALQLRVLNSMHSRILRPFRHVRNFLWNLVK